MSTLELKKNKETATVTDPIMIYLQRCGLDTTHVYGVDLKLRYSKPTEVTVHTYLFDDKIGIEDGETKHYLVPAHQIKDRYEP